MRPRAAQSVPRARTLTRVRSRAPNAAAAILGPIPGARRPRAATLRGSVAPAQGIPGTLRDDSRFVLASRTVPVQRGVGNRCAEVDFKTPAEFRSDRQPARQVTRMTDCAITGASAQEDESARLRELGDPEFFTHWAAVRNRLANAIGNAEVKREYDAVRKEYWRRINGGLTASAGN